MAPYAEMTDEQLKAENILLEKRYDAFKARGLSLNMARGKPSSEQLDLSASLLDVLSSDADLIDTGGVDTRNYGTLDGIAEARELLGQMMGVPADNVIVMGNSSLNVMYDMIARSMTHGVLGGTPWTQQKKITFLCPVPGYDRHFAVTQHFGIDMINIPMTPSGPDMDIVEGYVNEDESVKGIWCVPKYSNPQGITYSDETVRRFARLTPAASDFRIYWDNAYVVHDLYDQGDALLNINDECSKAGNPDLFYQFCSTSKITFAGAGISALSVSEANLASIRKQLSYQTIGYDKTNQLRHVRYFNDLAGIHAHMREHAALLAPKFEMVISTLEAELAGRGIGTWTTPRGGYFISFDAMSGCAKDIIAKAKAAGVVLTSAGATYPYGEDPADMNIRLAPSFPTLDELRLACELFVICVKLVSIRRLLLERNWTATTER